MKRFLLALGAVVLGAGVLQAASFGVLKEDVLLQGVGETSENGECTVKAGETVTVLGHVKTIVFVTDHLKSFGWVDAEQLDEGKPQGQKAQLKDFGVPRFNFFVTAPADWQKQPDSANGDGVIFAAPGGVDARAWGSFNVFNTTAESESEEVADRENCADFLTVHGDDWCVTITLSENGTYEVQKKILVDDGGTWLGASVSGPKEAVCALGEKGAEFVASQRLGK